MPYTDDKSKKFEETLRQALNEVRDEANYLDDLDDESLSETALQDEVRAGEADIWKTVEVNLNKYDLLEQTLRDREKEFANAAASENAEMSVSLDRVVESFEADLDNLKSEIDSSLLSQIKERLRLTINQKVQPNYQTILTMKKAPGLAEVLDPSQTVDTNAKSSLLYMLDTMPGGSIGIAGSRGAGKSTLIQMCCGPKRQLKDIQGIPILPVLTSAPVKYESRDFILYLFSAVCQRVLDPEDTNKELPQPPEVEGYSTPSPDMPVIDWLIRRSPGFLYKLGTVLMIMGLLAAVLISFFPAPPANQQTNQPQVQAAQTSAASSGQNVTQPVQTASPAASPQPAMGRTRTFITNFLRGIEIKPGLAITWAIFLWLSGFAISFIGTSYLESRAFPWTYEEYAAASSDEQGTWLSQADALEIRLRSRSQRLKMWYGSALRELRRMTSSNADRLYIIHRLQSFETRYRSEALRNPLKSRATRWLRETRFQQSFTSGWSGALKLPVGLEGGISRAVTLAQRQMSNPEIVAAYIKFVDEISNQYKLIIGIDELDKIESDDDAQKFLNEIKSIFGLQNCFYLVSVSENAMANFERRGLPFRDVFDSSFDNVVFVDYLNHQTAKELLRRRIVGKPYPFIYLSYCLSGGLPRDLIRNFRSLLEFNQEGDKLGGNSLGFLCQAVVTADLKAKIRATMASAKKTKSELAGSALTERLFEINSVSPTPESLLDTARTLLQWQPPMPPALPSLSDKAQDNSELDKMKQVKALSSELGSYLYLLSTVLAFFNDKLDEFKLKSAAQGGDLEKLANARQSMEINPSITVSLLNSLRTKWKFETLTPSTPGNGSQSPAVTIPAKAL